MANQILSEIVTRHVAELVTELESEFRARVREELVRYFDGQASAGRTALGARAGGAARVVKRLPCIAPGCKNLSKGPRFHYLCDTHKTAPKARIAAWQKASAKRRAAARAQRDAR